MQDEKVKSPDENIVTDVVANIMKAETFDIGAQRVEDFRISAQREQRRSLRFMLAKPSNVMNGLALLMRKDAQIRMRLLLLKEAGTVTRFVPPTPEFAEPELAQLLEEVHLVPAIDVTTSTPTGYLWPFRITAWTGYEKVFNSISTLDDSKQGLYVRYYMKSRGQFGEYSVDTFPLEPQQQEMWRDAPWPKAEDVYRLIEPVPFTDLLAANFNVRRAWATAEARRARKP